MKVSLIVVALFLCQLTYAQTVKDKKTKQEMIDRTSLLIEKVSGAREDLEREDVVKACEKIKEIYKIYPDHLMSIGSHLDFDRNRTVKAKDEALHQLILVHRQSLICDRGIECEYVDSKKLGKQLKEVQKSLKSQMKTIKKSDTDKENRFEYHYEF